MTIESAPAGTPTPDNTNASAETLGIVRLLAAGALLILVTLVGLILPGSVFKYTEPVLEPLTVIYANTAGRLVLAITLILLCVLFGLAVHFASRLSSRRSRRWAMIGTFLITIVFMFVYASGAQDMFHNLADVRTLWVYGDNPMLTPPTAHADDPLYPFVLAWQGSVSAYGPLFYVLGVPFSVVAGDDLLANVLAMKALHAIGLLGLAWLAGICAERLSPGRGVAAIVAVGWNPLLQWESVSNAHNDILMMAFGLASLALATRLFFSQSLIILGIAALVKYSVAAIAPLILIWSWRRAAEPDRLAVVSLVFAGAIGSLALYLVFPDTLFELRSFLTTDRVWKSPIGAIAYMLEPGLGSGPASDVARFACWALVLAAFFVSFRLLDATPRSLYRASFITLGALACFFRPEFFTWYFIWFVPIGAVLIGGWEWRLSYLASCFGLLTYAVFPWSPNTGLVNLAYVTFAIGAPLLLLGAFELGSRIYPPSKRSAVHESPATTRHELVENS